MSLVFAIAAVGAAAWYAWPAIVGARADGPEIAFATVVRGDVEDLVTATGTLQPRDYVDVGAQVSGQLKKIHVEVGTVVEAGELLAEIDPTLYRARVDASRAQLRNQRAQMLDRQAQLSLAEINHRRQKNLMAADATTAESLQTADAALKSARAQLAALEAQIQQTESTLRAEEANLNYAKIFAPMAGTVVSITARQGQTLNANQQAPIILRIADLSTMTVQTQVSEADVGRLRADMPVYFTTLGGQGRRWHSELQKVEPTPVVQNNVVLYNALFDVPNPNRALMTQMTAQVFFVAAAANDTLVVPVSALAFSRPTARSGSPATAARPAGTEARPQAESGTSGTRRATVQVAAGDGEWVGRQVTVGVTNRVQAQVIDGLEEGDRVATGEKRRRQEAGAQSSAQRPPAGMLGGPRFGR